MICYRKQTFFCLFFALQTFTLSKLYYISKRQKCLKKKKKKWKINVRTFRLCRIHKVSQKVDQNDILEGSGVKTDYFSSQIQTSACWTSHRPTCLCLSSHYMCLCGLKKTKTFPFFIAFHMDFASTI